MKLERYVLLEGGMVIDTTTNTKNHVFVKIYQYVSPGLHLHFELEAGDKLPQRALYNTEDFDYEKILATSPDIWGLIKEGWLIRGTFKCPTFDMAICDVDKDEKRDDGFRVCAELWNYPIYQIAALFAPITKDGKIVRYEKVWGE